MSPSMNRKAAHWAGVTKALTAPRFLRWPLAKLSRPMTRCSSLSNASNRFEPMKPVGFVNGDNAAVIDTPPTVGTAATGASPVGTYPITLTGGADDNYTLTLQNGTLTVTPPLVAPSIVRRFHQLPKQNKHRFIKFAGILQNIRIIFATRKRYPSMSICFVIREILHIF